MTGRREVPFDFAQDIDYERLAELLASKLAGAEK